MRFINQGKQSYPIVVILIICLISGCTSVQPVDQSPETLRSTLEVGDYVKITTKVGEYYEFTIEELNDLGISGDEVTVSYQDIDEIEATRLSNAGEAVAVIGGVAVLGAFIWYFIIVPIAAVVSLASWGGV